MSKRGLTWFPEQADWTQRFKAAKAAPPPFGEWVKLANAPLDFIKTELLHAAFQKAFPDPPATGLAAPPIRLALMGSSTTKHLHAGIRIAALRRGLFVTIQEPDYGQYWFELLDSGSALRGFAPNAVLFAFDARHLTRGLTAGSDATAATAIIEDQIAHLRACWLKTREAFDATILQQTILPVFPALAGQNEHILPGSPSAAVARLNAALRGAAATEGVHLVALDTQAARDGIAAWTSDTFWHRAKQEVSISAAPLYGDLVMRLLAARFGRSSKCLVLDLDNTLWGGVVGDDGVEGLALGQGSAEGEAFVAFQAYARDLAARGVILAVCSKNDEANALAPFERHPDMVLKRSDIACFIANWDDKATNLRRIAATLNIGLDSLVFVDDNPFERNLVREKLPEVAVPEISEDPSSYAQTIADAGYFEALALTEEDRARGAQYQANAARASMAGSANDIGAYLAGLEMRLIWNQFDSVGLPRIVQLINKSNQFNLTTRRYNDDDIRQIIADPNRTGLQLRLTDRFGDNGMIAVAILQAAGDIAVIDTWLMSCRVLGRKVEEATLALLVAQARRLGAAKLRGVFRPTAKNAMVKDHYTKLGFSPVAGDGDGDSDEQWFELALAGYTPPSLPMIIEAAEATTAQAAAAEAVIA
jgi:FkbH-like protein